MTAIRGLPPGRAGRLWLRRRQAAAETGRRTARRTAAAAAPGAGAVHPAGRTNRQGLGAHLLEANRWLLRAALIGHRRAIRLADDGATADVQLHWNTVMGVRYPTAASITPPPPSPTSPSPGTAALVQAAAATQPALQAAVQHAAATAALRAIDAELAVTRRRLHAINDRWLPRLAAAATTARLELDEQERAEAARLRWAAGIRGGQP
jgi:V/A-type H+-transporting ATPase subunit D